MADPATPAADTARAAAGGASKAAKGAGGVLSGKVFGMPRWAFLALLAGGLALGLYLRSRARADAAAAQDTPVADDLAYDPGMDPLTNPDTAAGYGVVGPGGGSVVPVQTPYIPPELTEAIAGLGGNLTDVIDFLTQQQNAVGGNGSNGAGTDTPAPPGADATGGGPPPRNPNKHHSVELTKHQQAALEKAIKQGHENRAQNIIDRARSRAHGAGGNGGASVTGGGSSGGRPDVTVASTSGSGGQGGGGHGHGHGHGHGQGDGSIR